MWSGQGYDDSIWDRFRKWRIAILAPVGVVAGIFIIKDQQFSWQRLSGLSLTGSKAIVAGVCIIIASIAAFVWSINRIRDGE